MKVIMCDCQSHALVLDAAEWNCAVEDSKWATLDLTMWTPVPTRDQRPWYRDLFYLPRYTWKLRELWKTWKGERYAEWVVLDRDGVKELWSYLDSLLSPTPKSWATDHEHNPVRVQVEDETPDTGVDLYG